MWDALVGPGWSLFEKTKWFREAGLDTSTIKRLVLIECRKNLALLEPLNLNDESVAQDAPAIIAVARRIEFASLEALLATDDKANKTLEELRDLPLQQRDEDSDLGVIPKKQPADKPVSVGERIIRLYVRMNSLRTFAEIWSEGEAKRLGGVREIRFRTRLKNLRDTLLKIESALSGSATV